MERLAVVDYNIKSWIGLHERPLIYAFDDRTSSELFTAKKNAILLVTPIGELGDTISAAFKEAATEWKIKSKKRLIFSAITVKFYLFSPRKSPSLNFQTTSK